MNRYAADQVDVTPVDVTPVRAAGGCEAHIAARVDAGLGGCGAGGQRHVAAFDGIAGSVQVA